MLCGRYSTFTVRLIFVDVHINHITHSTLHITHTVKCNLHYLRIAAVNAATLYNAFCRKIYNTCNKYNVLSEAYS